MADDDAWDRDDFEPELPSRPADDKWDGEDEDDDVKDNWEDEDEEKKEGDESQTQAAYQRPKKKPLAERIAEKEALKKKEEEERKTKGKEEKRELSAQERLQEKLRLQKIQEQQDLSLAKGLFGVSDSASIDKMVPTSEEEFEKFSEALISRITFFEESPHYSAFIVKFISDLSVGLGIEEVKKLGLNLNSLYHEKERVRKEAEKKKKKKAKATIKMDRSDYSDILGETAGGDYTYEDDDFI